MTLSFLKNYYDKFWRPLREMDGFEIYCKTTSAPRLKQGPLTGTGCAGQTSSSSTPALHLLFRGTEHHWAWTSKASSPCLVFAILWSAGRIQPVTQQTERVWDWELCLGKILKWKYLLSARQTAISAADIPVEGVEFLGDLEGIGQCFTLGLWGLVLWELLKGKKVFKL